MMKKIVFSFGMSVWALGVMAQTAGFQFTDKIRLKCADIQDQGYSGTCWCFSSTSFLESEMIANGVQNPPNVSEMFIVRNNYIDRAVKYVMLGGNMTFGEGSYFMDVIAVGKAHGLVPESAMPNFKASEKSINHSSLISATRQFADSVAKIDHKAINPDWVKDYTKLLDSYFPQSPESFVYEGNTYTPESFAEQYCKINFNDYIQVTSFSHHEFGKFFQLEIPDNWRWSSFLNVPVDDLIDIIDASLAMGHTVLWASDVSETGFSMKNGYAVLPGIVSSDANVIKEFKELPADKQALRSRTLNAPGVEVSVTQDTRQIDFLNKKTTDDHGMHIIGSATDQAGNEYYIVKNSWGDTGKYHGYLYASKSYVKAKTTGIMVNKCALGNRLDNAVWE